MANFWAELQSENVGMFYAKKKIKNQLRELKVAKTAVFDMMVSCIYEFKNNGIEVFTVVCLVTWPLNKSEAGGHCFCCVNPY